MIVDSSALIAILTGEADALTFVHSIRAASHARASTATILETSMVFGRDRQSYLDSWLQASAIEVVAFDDTQLRLAREGWVRFGKGSGSPARLNFGDCMSYALAKATGEPLLFKGDDFTHTDIEPALTQE